VTAPEDIIGSRSNNRIRRGFIVDRPPKEFHPREPHRQVSNSPARGSLTTNSRPSLRRLLLEKLSLAKTFVCSAMTAAVCS
jgi:hypothetical protein